MKEICKYTFRLFLIILLEEFEDTKTKNITKLIQTSLMLLHTYLLATKDRDVNETFDLF